MRTATFGFLITLLLGCSIAGYFVGWFCVGNENRDPAVADEEVCELIGSPWTLRWWLTLLWPSLLFGATQLTRTFRGHALVFGAGVVVLAAIFWISLGFLVVDL